MKASFLIISDYKNYKILSYKNYNNKFAVDFWGADTADPVQFNYMREGGE